MHVLMLRYADYSDEFACRTILTCIFWTPTHMLHGRDTHLFTRTTDPMTLTCRGLHLNAYGRHSAVRFSHQQHLHLPCLPPKNPPSGLNLTKISLPARTSFVVRTYILTTNSAFRCTRQQVLLTFPYVNTPKGAVVTKQVPINTNLSQAPYPEDRTAHWALVEERFRGNPEAGRRGREQKISYSLSTCTPARSSSR